MPCVFCKGHKLYNVNGGGCWTLHHYHFIDGLRALWLSLEAIVLGHGPMTWEGMPLRADITLMRQQSQGD